MCVPSYQSNNDPKFKLQNAADDESSVLANMHFKKKFFEKHIWGENSYVMQTKKCGLWVTGVWQSIVICLCYT